RRQPNETVLLEPAPSLLKSQLAGAKCLVSLHKNKATFRLMNPTEQNINLACKTTVALVSDIDINAINTLYDPMTSQSSHMFTLEDNALSANTTASQQTFTPDSYTENPSANQPCDIDFDLSDSDLSEPQKTQLRSFLYKNQDLFSTGLHDLGQTTLCPHEIDTGNARPVKMPFYRQTPVMRQEIDRQVNDMLDNGIIKESHSAWHSPVVLIKKSDGK
ncbi:MAG: hypothetical protein AB2693_25745, partial [Candidatus Thiodiazotropha sp.]